MVENKCHWIFTKPDKNNAFWQISTDCRREWWVKSDNGAQIPLQYMGYVFCPYCGKNIQIAKE